VYVAPFPGPGGATLVSTGGGGQPLWSKDGKEIFYVHFPPGRIMAAEVKSDGGTFAVGAVRELFTVNMVGARSTFDVTRDGQRFLVNTRVAEPQGSPRPPMTVVVNWAAEIKK
jgi:hypothetical protein